MLLSRSELKRTYPQFYARVAEDQEVKDFVATLFSNGTAGLRQFRICEHASDENYRGLYRDINNYGDDVTLAEVVGSESVRELHQTLSCLAHIR